MLNFSVVLSLVIDVSTVHGTSIIPVVTEMFSDLYPQVTLTIIQQETPEVIESVSQGNTLGILCFFR